MKIPFVNLRIQHEQIEEEINKAIERVRKRSWFILGDEVEAFEAEFAEYCNVSYCIGVGSGTDALYLALRAFDIGRGDEVITASHTFIATAMAISRTGATPVFVDIEPVTYTIDPKLAAQAITERTKAIIPVHIYGQSAEMQSLLALAQRYNLWLIEDACQAHGAVYDNYKVGSIGHSGCFSFYPSKNLVAFGDGGAITTNDEELAHRLRMLRNYGQTKKYHHKTVGFNSRLDELQAAILRVKLKHLDTWNGARNEIANKYSNSLSHLIKTPDVRPGNSHVYHLYVVGTNEREALQRFLRNENIETQVHYPIPVHLQEAYAIENTCIRTNPLKRTQDAAEQVLSLPMYPYLTDQDQDFIVSHIQAFINKT